MDSTPGFILDEDRYRTEVLHLASSEAEQARAQQLSDEARQLGLKVPETVPSTPVTASIASGMLDPSSPVLSSGSSTNRNSVYDGSITPSHEPSSPLPLNQVVSSLSDVTLASRRLNPGSARSFASLSTRPTSFCSSETRTLPNGYANGYANGYESRNDGLAPNPAANPNRMSVLSVGSADKKEKPRSSFRNVIGRISFRKKRPPNVIPPPIPPPNNAPIVSKGKTGVDRVYLEIKRQPPPDHDVYERPATAAPALSRLRIPIYDKQAMQRSLDDPELSEMVERHRMERDRHVAFQDAALSNLRRRHQTAVSELQTENERLEEEKEEMVCPITPAIYRSYI